MNRDTTPGSPTDSPPGSSPDVAAAELRDAMVDLIRARGHAHTPAVETAMRAVPRHAFVPDAPAGDAYADLAVITKRAADGAALSCASVPAVVAMMLDQLQIRPGDRVLEIGAGTGYNAALLAHLVGPTGSVTTIDIDPEVTAEARRNLDATGFGYVQVITRDGADGAPEHAPYDRIIVTVGAWDLPPAWTNQLADTGRLVLPLRWRGQTRSVAFHHHRDQQRLVADGLELCGFVPMIGQHGEHTTPIDHAGHVRLHHDIDQHVDPAALRDALTGPPAIAWSGVTVGPEDSFDGLWLLLTATEPGACRIATDPTALDHGLHPPVIPARSPAIVDGSSFTYLVHRPVDHLLRHSELGTAAYGPDSRALADRLATRITTWNADRDHRPHLEAHPASVEPRLPLGGLVTDKHHTRLIMTMGGDVASTGRRPAVTITSQ